MSRARDFERLSEAVRTAKIQLKAALERLESAKKEHETSHFLAGRADETYREAKGALIVFALGDLVETKTSSTTGPVRWAAEVIARRKAEEKDE